MLRISHSIVVLGLVERTVRKRSRAVSAAHESAANCSHLFVSNRDPTFLQRQPVALLTVQSVTERSILYHLTGHNDYDRQSVDCLAVLPFL
jgi:hypothetical protein